MKKISGYVDPEKWSKRLNLPYYKQEWFNYKVGLKNRHGDTNTASFLQVGHVWNFETRRNTNQKLHSMLNSIINDDWKYAGSLYAGLIAFCLKYCKDEISYYEDNRGKNLVSVSRCCEELKFPTWCRERLEKIFTLTPSLENFLHNFDDVPQVDFDVDAALMVYKMQGEKAIFSILMQLFFRYRYVTGTTANLVPELPIIWTPEVSDFVNGTTFPVVATKFSNDLKWEKNDEGFFLFDEFDNPIDCACVGSFSLFNTNLGNRLSFLERSGVCPNYVICWSWGDLVNAVGQFNGDILVRNLSGKFYGWFKFGLEGKMAVWTEDGYVYSKKGNKRIPNLRIMSYPGEGRWTAIINLAGERVDDKLDEEVVWNWEEMCDWLELGKWCKEKLKK